MGTKHFFFCVSLLCALLPQASEAQVPTRSELWFMPGEAADGSFKFHAAADAGTCLETDGNVFSAHDRVQTFFCYASNGFIPGTVQEWLLLPAGRSASGAMQWELANREYSKCLDTVAVSGSDVSAQPCNGGAGQLWEFLPSSVSPGVTRQFSLRSIARGLVLTRGGTTDGSPLRLTALGNSSDQAWQAVGFSWGTGPAISSANYVQRYRIELRSAPGKVLDVWGISYDNNVPIQVWDWWGGGNQQFAFFNARDPVAYPAYPQAGFYSLFAQHSGKVMDLYGFSRDPGARVVQWSWFGTLNQAWVVLPARDVQYVHIINGNSGLALQPSGGATANGTAMTQAHFNGSWEQMFRLISVP